MLGGSYKARIKIGELRVYHDIEEEPDKRLMVPAVGIKDRNRIIIGGEEIEL